MTTEAAKRLKVKPLARIVSMISLTSPKVLENTPIACSQTVWLVTCHGCIFSVQSLKFQVLFQQTFDHEQNFLYIIIIKICKYYCVAHLGHYILNASISWPMVFLIFLSWQCLLLAWKKIMYGKNTRSLNTFCDFFFLFFSFCRCCCWSYWLSNCTCICCSKVRIKLSGVWGKNPRTSLAFHCWFIPQWVFLN